MKNKSTPLATAVREEQVFQTCVWRERRRKRKNVCVYFCVRERKRESVCTTDREKGRERESEREQKILTRGKEAICSSSSSTKTTRTHARTAVSRTERVWPLDSLKTSTVDFSPWQQLNTRYSRSRVTKNSSRPRPGHFCLVISSIRTQIFNRPSNFDGSREINAEQRFDLIRFSPRRSKKTKTQQPFFFLQTPLFGIKVGVPGLSLALKLNIAHE